jgi:hypothetical protein
LHSEEKDRLHFPANWFAREEGRMRLRGELARRLNEGESRDITLSNEPSSAYRGISIRAGKIDSHVTFDFKFDECASLAGIAHPLAALLPSLDAGHCYVETSACDDAKLVFLDSRLVGPAFAHGDANATEMLVRYIGRSVNEEDGVARDLLGRRYVEPGTGRGYLVDFLRLNGYPEFYDFSVIGGGLTPYSRGGYINVGRPIDGKVSLGRALHRKQCADRLAKVGCRVAPVVAIIELKDNHILLYDGGHLPVALVVRAFRSVLRVRQLDPVACLYHSEQARPNLAAFLMDARWNLRDQKALPRTQAQGDMGPSRKSHRIGPSGKLLRVGPLSRLWDPFPPDTRVRRMRLRATRIYAPLLLDAVKARVAVEIGRDPFHEPLSNFEYAQWFASTMGRQLALFRRERFLHDYHQEGISYPHQLPRWLYTLGENNVTLMAEFPDLDTGIFVDSPGAESIEELRLTRRDRNLLSSNFASFHARDFRATRSVVSGLVMVACHGRAKAINKALGGFEEEYHKLSRYG